MVTIRCLVGLEASVEDRVWTSDDAMLQRLCRVLARGIYEEASYDPNPDLSVAKFIIGHLGGEIIQADPVPPVPRGMDA